MRKAYKITSIKLFPLINSIVKVLIFLFVLSACQTPQIPVEQPKLTEREMIYQKGVALFKNAKYAESSGFFLKIAQTSLGPQDETYNAALWNLSFIYEKLGEFDKAILALIELEARGSKKILLFSIRLRLIKNYFRIDNPLKAIEIQKHITSHDLNKLLIEEIYLSLEENVQFNYDSQMLEELHFLGQVQKYFITVMESPTTALNTKATDLLTSLYDNFLKVLEKDTLNIEFKRTLAIELLDQFRKFELYKRTDVTLNPYAISKFSNYANEKQQIITDWLHR